MAKRMRAIEMEERAAARGRRLSQAGMAMVNGERMTELELQRDQLRARVELLEAQLQLGRARAAADHLDAPAPTP